MRSLVRGVRRAFTLSAAASLLLVGTAAPSSAQVVFTVERCGETVSGNVRLTGDLDCRDLDNWFDENGDESYGAYHLTPYSLRVEGSGTIDLNGYTIITGPILDVDYEYDAGQDRNEIGGYLFTWTGEALSTYDPDGDDDDEFDFYPSIGVLVEDSVNVTVRNGVVRGARGDWAYEALDIEGFAGNQVLVVNSRDVVLEDLAVSENANIMGSGPGVMTDLSDVDNAFDGSGVAVVASDRVSIARVDSFRNDGSGLTIYASRDIDIIESSFNDNDGRGIFIAGGYDNPFDYYDFTWSGFRASRDIDMTDVETVSNGGHGIRVVFNLEWYCGVFYDVYDFCFYPEDAFELPRNGGGTWTNVTSMSNDGDGIYLDGSEDITIQDSYLVSNDGDGAYFSLTEDIVVQRTTIEANGDDGIDAVWDPFTDVFGTWWDRIGPMWFAVEGEDGSGEVGTEGDGDDSRVRPAHPHPEEEAGPGLQVLSNVITDNDDDGIDLYQTLFTIVDDNLLQRNFDHGMEVEEAVFFLAITRNRAIDNDVDGFNLGYDGDVDQVVMERNHAEGNGADGFDIMDVDDSRFVRNVAVDNRDNGFEVDGSDDSLYDRNEARDNADSGFAIGSGTDDTLFRRNHASDNGTNGFSFEDPDLLSFISNRATGNDSDGFYMDSYDDTVPGFVVYRGNRADRNGGWGHISYGDTVDHQRGVSTVRGNGGRRNGAGLCLNVRCGRRLLLLP